MLLWKATPVAFWSSHACQIERDRRKVTAIIYQVTWKILQQLIKEPPVFCGSIFALCCPYPDQGQYIVPQVENWLWRTATGGGWVEKSLPLGASPLDTWDAWRTLKDERIWWEGENVCVCVCVCLTHEWFLNVQYFGILRTDPIPSQYAYVYFSTVKCFL